MARQVGRRAGSFMLATEATGFCVATPIADRVFLRLEQMPWNNVTLREGLVAELTPEMALRYAEQLVEAAMQAMRLRDAMPPDTPRRS